MKKTLSCTLAATLAAAPLQGFANEVVKESNEKTTTFDQTTSITGKLEVDINFYVPIINSEDNDMKVSLSGGNISVSEEISLAENFGKTKSGLNYTIEKLDSKRNLITEEDAEVSFIRVIFDNLSKGKYDIELSGSGYNTATVDDIDITSYSKRVRIGTKQNEVVTKYGETEEQNVVENYPALFLAGDVNTDNIIDMEDYNIVLNSIKNNENNYDINKDSKTDISDLSAIKSSMGAKSETNMKDYIDNTDPIIDPNTVGMEVEEGTEVNGKTAEEAKEELKKLLTSEFSTVSIGKPGQTPSEENPIKLDLNLTSNQRSNDAVEMEQIIIKSSSRSNENAGAPETGFINYTNENGEEIKVPFDNSNVRKSKDGSDDIVIDLGSQVAVKEISINVTGNRGNKNISEIAKIEFLNNVYKEIPKPELSIPTIKTLETSTNLHDERITISWEAQPNVTSYEVKYYKINDNGDRVGPEKKLQTNKTELNILDKQIKPYDKFRVSIQSLNGEWSSGYAEDLAKIDEDKGGLSAEQKKTLIPNELDGVADNVDKDFNKKDDYYGLNGHEPNIGSVSDIQVIPISAPEPPRNLTVKEGYRSLEISWENHIQARDFDIFYRKLGDEDKRWIKANDPSVVLDEEVVNSTPADKSKLHRGQSYTLNGLDDESTYEVRVTATNHLGTSKMSQTYLGTTKTLDPPKMTNYKLINTPKGNVGENEVPTDKIIDVVNHSNAEIHNKFAVVDNDYSTEYIIRDWDAGGNYAFRGPMITFDQEYTIDRISLATSQQQGNYPLPNDVRLVGFDKEGNETVYKLKSISTTASNGKSYATIKLDEPITVNKIQVNISVPSTNGNQVTISELKFHESDNIEKDLKNLYKDEFRLELKDNVTQETIDDLRKRVNTMDPVSKEYNPDRTSILKELDNAELLLEGADLSDTITTLDPKIRVNSGATALGMSNDWQSLGAVARPGKDGEQKKKIVVYVGSNNKNAKVELAFLQNFGQPNSYINTDGKAYTFAPGRYEIEIPEIFNNDVEKGGQVMVRVKSANPNDVIKVRLAGVDEIPHLNVNNIINEEGKENEVKDEIRKYIRNLKKHVSDLPNMYPESVTSEDRKNNIYPYEERTSVLNTTDIEGDRFTLTLPASQILKGIESGISGNENAQVERVYNALLAWEQQIQLGYAKKGVYETGENATGNHIAPTARMNIKYQRMIMGAAGYATSHHVGVGFGDVPAYMKGVPFKFDENQNVINKNEAHLYGDLINHEIGHVLDIKNRTYDETSNNLLVALSTSMLNQNPSKLGKDTYKKMYAKSTSNTLGLSTDRNVVLGMLWQPHLAYEDKDTYKMLLNDDSYFAKLNRAYRDMTEEEKANANKDQLLIRMTSKVANKNLTNFYLSYGIVPNETTLKYVSQFEEETRPIQYINDEARRKRLAGTADMSDDTRVIANFGKDNKGNKIVDKSYVNQNTVPLELSVNKDSDKILGFEIYRNGIPVGFVEADKSGETTYDDIVDNINNRVFTYEAVAYDYNLKATKKVNLGTIKVRHDKAINKSKLNITSNTVDINEENYDEHADNPNPSLANIIDDKDSTVYEGKKLKNEDPYVLIDTNEVKSLAGIKYTAPTTTTKLFKKSKTSKQAINNYKIEVSKNGNDWTTVKNGSFKLDPNNPTETIYFDKQGVEGGNQLNVYNARFVKLTAVGATNISIAELDLISPPGDNIEIGVAEDNINYKNGLGILKEDFIYQPDDKNTPENEEKKIPKGSVIITGEYRGNPAFNVPLVLNEKEENIADKYNGILMAEIPNNGNLEEISEGNWVYWVEPEYANQFMENKEIFAELYRTDTADAQEGGQRLVSDTFKIDVPNELPEISLSGGQGKTRGKIKYTEINTKTIKNIKSNR